MRRNDTLTMVPAELAIRDAILAVEAIGAHTDLTDAVILLLSAKDKVSDYIDTQIVPTEEEQPNDHE